MTRDPAKFCSVDGCDKLYVAHGLCDAHYRRWLAHGDPLGGRVPPGTLLRYFNETVLSYEGDDCLTWPFSKTLGGYGHMRLSGRTQLVSRLICEKVYGPPPTPKHEAAHSCGRGRHGCVTKGHLNWKTPPENAADKIAHGTDPRGERHGMAKLTEPQVSEIRSLKGIVFQREIAAKFGICRASVSMIHSGKSWGWLNA